MFNLFKKSQQNTTDPTLERVRFIQVELYDKLRDNEKSVITFEVSGKVRGDHYEFFIDSDIITLSRFDKGDIVLLDSDKNQIPMNGHSYAFEMADDCGFLCVY